MDKFKKQMLAYIDSKLRMLTEELEGRDELERRIVLNRSQLTNATSEIQKSAAEGNWEAMDKAFKKRRKCQKTGKLLRSKLEKVLDTGN